MRNLALMWVLAGCLMGCGGKPPVSTFTDTRDGKVYRIVKIGGQTWFAENLNYAAEGSKCYGEIVTNGEYVYDKNGRRIRTTLLNSEAQANCKKYGRLYNWKTALTACPAGTHLPSDKEWTTLVDYAGGEKTAGKKLKSTAGWKWKKGNGADYYGFLALPGGLGNSDGRFGTAGNYGRWWSATEDDAYYAWSRRMYCDNEGVDRNNNKKAYLFSVRCVLDDEKEKRK
jgi:uncharacterized protein (TIGR02145 family)